MATIIHKGKVKYLAGEYHRGNWKKCDLTLLSDATLQLSFSESDTLSLDTKLLSVAMPMLANTNGFIIKTVEDEAEQYSSGPIFTAATNEECQKWMVTINETILQRKIATKHKHPLPGQGAQKYISEGTMCAICSKIEPYNSYHFCEYCEDYKVCNWCYRRFYHLPRYPKVKSVTHPHQLFQSELASMTMTIDHNSNLQCSRCNNRCKGTFYVCPECPFNYYECSTCAYSLINNELSASKEMKLDLVNLDHVIHSTASNTYKLEVGDKRCPDAMSLISQQHWDLSRIDAEPAPNAYFEVTFKSFSDSVGVGIGNQIFSQNCMLGQQQNSYGYLSDGSLWVSNKSKVRECTQFPQIEPGDTIGAGILIDSFTLRRLYITKNGNMLGCFPGRVHRGMDCFPGVSFKKNSGVEFEVNMIGPFKFDVNSVPNYRNDKTDRLQTIPKEVIANILSYSTYPKFSSTNHSFAVQLQLVSKRIKEAARDNEVWRHLFRRNWPTAYTDLKVKSWMSMYQARFHVARFDAYDSHPIENCEFEFQCPIMWEELITTNNEAERFCDKCQKTVYEVSDTETLDKYARMGRCVSLILRREYDYYSERLGGEAPQPERHIPYLDDALESF